MATTGNKTMKPDVIAGFFVSAGFILLFDLTLTGSHRQRQAVFLYGIFPGIVFARIGAVQKYHVRN
ncbi:hypothetical protein [Sedimenticola hydrogenitrophicus]|uniref:hypothetical protein n=1 Tax=Sedimenticola hydrogenitrophicus TaxID=2967975 RepID=UPI0023B2017A|nr:hypothetical protein [Sedimenticola hydrogenitrophicus]